MHPRLVHTLALALAAGALLAACGGSVPDAATPAPTAGGAAQPASPGPSAAAPTAPSVPPADPAAVAAARATIDAARLDDPATLDAVSAVRYDDGAPEAAARVIADGAPGDARWAAVYTYAASGTDPAVLRPVLTDPDPTLRAMAAAALAAWGDPAGLPVLGELAGSSDSLQGSYPPVSIGAFAIGTLAQLAPGAGIDPSTPPEEQGPGWTAWLGANAAALAFDQEAGTWSAR